MAILLAEFPPKIDGTIGNFFSDDTSIDDVFVGVDDGGNDAFDDVDDVLDDVEAGVRTEPSGRAVGGGFGGGVDIDGGNVDATAGFVSSGTAPGGMTYEMF